VLVEIAYSGACGTQVMEWRAIGRRQMVPHCLGHEGTGVVQNRQRRYQGKPGDKVLLSMDQGQRHQAGGAVYAGTARRSMRAGSPPFNAMRGERKSPTG